MNETSYDPDMETAFLKFIEVLPQLVWPLVVGIIVWRTRVELGNVLKNTSQRLAQGATVKLGIFQIDAATYPKAKQGELVQNNTVHGVFVDKKRNVNRDKLYSECRNAMVVHRLERSAKQSGWYDALVYVIPRRTHTLIGLVKVEYFFGPHWEHQVYTSEDRNNGFAVHSEIYGPTLVIARLFFNDDTWVETYRYLDFEMG